MSHLRKETHALYDDPVKWGTFGIWEPPAFDVDGYQKRIDAVVGTSLGQPIVRLVWAWDKRCRESYYTKWNFTGKGTELEFEYKYRVARVPIGDDNTVDICPPRWLFEQRYEPGQYTPSWEQSRWAEKDVGKRHTCGRSDEQLAVETCDCEDVRARVELRPPAPRDGWYQLLWAAAEHDENRECCDRLYKSSRRNCWGYYRLPNDKDLERLQRAVKLRDADIKRVDPHAPMPPEAVDEVFRAAFIEQEEIDRRKDAELTESYRDFAKSAWWRIREAAGSKRLHHGPYHIFNNPFSRTKSGLIVPNE